MADKLALGRATEIDALSSEVVRMAQGLNLSAPLNARIVDLVRDQSMLALPWNAPRLLAALGLPR